MFSFAFLPLVAFAQSLIVPTLPEGDFADTESSTNIVIDASDEYWGKLDILLAANATVSNNVQIAVGIDADENGVLEPMETDVVLGWDSGAWLLKDEYADWSWSCPMEPGARELVFSLRIIRHKSRALKIADGDVLFDAAVPDIPESLFNPSWNLLRVTSRGRALRDELIVVKPTSFGMVLEVR